MHILSKILLFPFTILYGLGVGARNLLYDLELLKSVKYNLPVISVGNLTVGGAGKTPHVEYLIELLKDYLNVATLSRGYKRKSKGFKFIQEKDSVLSSGDEPLQYKKKYPQMVVAVSESRALGIPQIIKNYPQTNVVLLDDAFQHRSIEPGLNILLTDYSNLYVDDYLLPAGRLREWRSAAQRADVIIVTKCPFNAEEIDGKDILERLDATENQKVFFSYYQYGHPYYMYNSNYRVDLKNVDSIVLVSAIAKLDYLMDYLDERVETVSNFKYEDHHLYSEHEVSLIKQAHEMNPDEKKLILSTEKDATRLDLHRQFLIENKLPVYILPVKVAFHYEEGRTFDDYIKDFLLKFKI